MGIVYINKIMEGVCMYKLFKSLALLVFVVGVGWSQPDKATQNIQVVFDETLSLLGTGSDTSMVFWQTEGGLKSILISANDTSAAGFASDSCVATIKMYQVFKNMSRYSGTTTLNAGVASEVIMLNSRAHPDSVTSQHAGSASFNIVTTYDVKSMDTASILNLTRGAYITGKSSRNVWANAYFDLAPSYSNGVAFIATGGSANKKGKPTLWRIRIFQEVGAPVVPKS